MRIVVAVTAFNSMSFLRTDLLRKTFYSVEVAFPSAERVLLNNGSTDMSRYFYRELVASSRKRWDIIPNATSNTTPGRGRNTIMNYLRSVCGDETEEIIVVFSDDDIVWKPDAGEKLDAFWDSGQQEVAILGGLLEDEYRHNTPRRAIEHGGVRAVVRDSAPGAAWSFRYQDWWLFIGPAVDDFGYDTKCCKKLLAEGRLVAQADLVEHIGHGGSTHGNDLKIWQKPFDREKWGV